MRGAFVAFSVILAAGLRDADAFFQAAKPQSTLASSAAANEAVAIYQKRYPKKGEATRFPWDRWGVPKRDIDGTEFFVGSSGSKGGKLITDIDDKKARTTFAEIAKLYGEETALGMTKAMPFILTFEPTKFAGALREFQTIFGDDEAKAMVARNPGLLSSSVASAAKADDLTMQLSYVVAVTRPYSKTLLASLFALLLIPAFESVSGISVRAIFFTSLTGSDPAEIVRSLSQASDPLGVFSSQ